MITYRWSLFVTLAIMAAGQVHALPDSPQGTSTASPSALGPAHTDGQCHFRLKESPDEGYTHKAYMFYANKHNPNGWGFGFTCYAGAPPDKIDEQLDIARKDGKIVWSGTGEPFSPEQHFRMQIFSGKNWTGTAVGYDMTTGPEEARGRILAQSRFQWKRFMSDGEHGAKGDGVDA